MQNIAAFQTFAISPFETLKCLFPVTKYLFWATGLKLFMNYGNVQFLCNLRYLTKRKKIKNTTSQIVF